MAGLPVMSGAVHDTSIFVSGVVELFDTLIAGAAGGSFNVGHADGHRDGVVDLRVGVVVGVLAVADLDGQAVRGLGLVVGDLARLHRDLAGRSGRWSNSSLSVPFSE